MLGVLREVIMVRNVDHDLRKKAVLAATINKYIQEATPVSSGDISKVFNLSSATIRSIFSELEKDGYLTHPYTSGGRIPTSRGYRYYVDFLAAQMEVLDAEKQRITREYERKVNRLEDALEKTSEIISAITHYTGIVSLVEEQDRFFYKGLSSILDQPEFHDFERTRHLIKVIEDRELLLDIINRELNQEKVQVYIGEELDCDQMQECSLVVTSYSLNDRPSGRIAVLGPKRMRYDHIIPTLEYISDALTDFLERI